MDILFQGAVAKFGDRPEDNEDASHVAAERGRIVVSDGASESFDARNWAGMLVEAFSECDPTLPAMQTCQAQFEALHNPADMSWSKAAAYERGSFATLLIVQDDPETQSVCLTCVGDSFAVLTDGERLLESLPYRNSDDFNNKPLLISTLERHNALLWLKGNPMGLTAQWSYRNKPLYLLCMTDALGAWLLDCVEQGNHNALKRLVGIRSVAELEDLVETEREQRVMRRDDCTLIIASLQGEA